MKKKGVYLFCLFVFASINRLYAGTGYGDGDTFMLFYRHFNVADGLSGNENYFVYEDSRRNIWICSDNGVTRFDGTTFHDYDIQNGLCFNVNFGCKEDMNGHIWFYSYTGELTRYDVVRNQFECPSFNDSLSAILQGGIIKRLDFDRDTIYIATQGHSYKLSPRKDGSYAIKDIVIPEGTLVVHIGQNYIPMCNIVKNDTKIRLVISGKTKDTIMNIRILDHASNDFAGITCDSIYYFVFGKNMLRYNFNTHVYSVMKLPFMTTPCITKTNEGLLCGSRNDGIWSLVPSGDTMSCTRLSPKAGVSSAIQNHQGAIWGSSHEEGLFYVPVTYAWWLPKKGIGDSENVQAVYSSGDSVFYTTKGGSLYVLYKSRGQLCNKLLTKLPNNIINIYRSGNSNKVLLQSYSTTFCYDITYRKFITDYEDFPLVQNSVVANIHNIEGVPRLSLKYYDRNQLYQLLVPGRWQFGKLRSVVMIGNKKIFMGNMFDLFAVDIGTKTVRRIGKKNGLNRMDVLYILALNRDTVLVGTRYGIFAIAGDSVIKHIDSRNGLSGNVVYSILKDGDNLYVATSKGIDIIQNLFGTGKPKIRSITYQAGIYSCQVTHLANMNNFLVAGTDKGIFVIDKDKSLGDSTGNSLVLTGIYINNNPIQPPVHRTIEINHGTNSIGFDYTTFSSRNIFNNKFRYRLTDQDDETWHYTSQTKIDFFSISPGQRMFELQVMNPNGTWNPNGINYTVDVLPPFWQKWWFLVMCGILMSSGLYIIFRFRLHEVRKIGRLKNRLLEAQFQALGMQLNPHFVYNALNSVSAYMANNDTKSTFRFLGKFAKLMRTVFRNSQHTMVLLEDELKALKLYLELESIRLENKFGYDIRINDDVNPYDCKIPSLILQPIIENAIWHGFVPTNEKGFLSVNIFKQQNNLVVEIIDDGIGRTSSAKIKRNKPKERHSLEIIAERLNLLREQTGHAVHMDIGDRIKGVNDSGTRVILVMPYHTSTFLKQML